MPLPLTPGERRFALLANEAAAAVQLRQRRHE
jgi:hypothetical protein